MADQFRYCLGGIRRVASAKRFRAVECRETKKGAGLALSIFPGELIQGIFAINSSPCGTFSGEKEREREREGEERYDFKENSLGCARINTRIAVN